MSFTSSETVNTVGTKLVFNDGFASTIDFDVTSSESYQKVLIFREGIIKDYESIKYTDQRKGFPGVRGVITIGQRFSYDSCNISSDVFTNRIVSYFPSAFQMNTAFSKAFLMEESGSRANLCGSSLFIDVEVYNFLRDAAKTLGYTLPQVHEQENEIQIKIYNKDGWFITVIVDHQEYPYGPNKEYSNRGIETKLYRFHTMHSLIDVLAGEAAYFQARRYSLIDEE